MASNLDKRTPTAMGGKAKWPGEWCKRCNRRNVIGWSVSDDVWNRVVGGRWNILCSGCFDEEAELRGILYSFDNELYPVSWNEWSNNDGEKK